MTYRSKTNLGINQSGLVSIAVTMVLLSVITLITVSFAFLMRREQQQVLDRQLSTQAFYAAESGVNDAIAAISSGEITGDVTDCNAGTALLNPDLSGDGVTSYSCVLINNEVQEIIKNPIPIDESELIKLDAKEGNIQELIISWEASGEGDGSIFANDDRFLLPTEDFQAGNSSDFSNHIGILRTSVLPVSPSVDGSISRGNINAADKSFFLYPTAAGVVSGAALAGRPAPDEIDYNNPDVNGAFVSGECVADRSPMSCRATISNIGGLSGAELVYLRLRSIYQPSSIHIEGFDSAGERVTFINYQAVVDVTGRANDVLRRIQVRVPLRREFDYTDSVFQSMDDICKQLEVAPGSSNAGSCY